MENLNKKVLEVYQQSILGRLALSALATRFCGPAYDLGDLKVRVCDFQDFIQIDFYDMGLSLYPTDASYDKIRVALN